jgi:hypothetical protein
MAKAVVLILVGPSKTEIHRLSDTIESIKYHEPNGGMIFLVDDSLIERGLKKCLGGTKNSGQWTIQVIKNPRRGIGDGWASGLCVGVLAGLLWIYNHVSYVDFVLKIDTDSLIINPFIEKINGKFTESPLLGLLGSYKMNPNGTARHTLGWKNTLSSYLKPICMRGKTFQTTLWGRGKRIKMALLKAIENGYQITEHCQGGGYAINWHLLNHLFSNGMIKDPLDWLYSGCAEDVMMGMYCRAGNMKMLDFNRSNEPFGVQYKGLPFALETLIDKQFSIIHSLKDTEFQLEADIRKFFQRKRQSARIHS